jgi:triphosphoribosyl-dephospho-CoA synthase
MTVASSRAQNTAVSSAKFADPAMADAIGALATTALLQELAAWPKPGLVSHRDSGSHRDMDASILQASAAALTPYFAELARAGQAQVAMNALREIGLRAEAAMLRATGGVNTHRGAIFGLGLLTAAAGATTAMGSDGRLRSRAHLGRVVAGRWGEAIHKGPVPLFSHGSEALRRYGAGGARAEAASGFPSVYEIGLPALRAGRRLGGDAAGHVQACFALIASVNDTNLLHRGGPEGAHYAAASAAAFLAGGGVGTAGWLARAIEVHRGFVARNLSPGGCADLLAMTLFIDALQAGVPAE